ncbi:hypothetical protein ACGFY7_42620 [Streptomyces prunicolor]|uniref:hypothetical protein n=1 Tax=Streptomyces prunicolor TaxID=67348 RepID=UPI0037104B21
MTLLRRPRFWVRLVSITVFLLAGWLLLVPRTASYLVSDEGRPYDMSVLYSWDTSDQTLIFPKAFFEEDSADTGESSELVTSVRLDCGTAFTSGENEDARPGDGEEACSEVETPRRFLGLGLVLLGAAGLWSAPRLSRLLSRMPWTGPQGNRER